MRVSDLLYTGVELDDIAMVSKQTDADIWKAIGDGNDVDGRAGCNLQQNFGFPGRLDGKTPSLVPASDVVYGP